jgi:hypothetical protein
MFAYCLTMTGVSVQQAERMELAVQQDPQPGLVLHAAGPNPAGTDTTRSGRHATRR